MISISGFYLTEIEYEKTDPNKERIKMIYHLNAIHYIVKGKGYFNGKLLQAGDGFVCFHNNAVDYYPDKSEPWEYAWLRLEGENIDFISCICDSRTFCFQYHLGDFFYNTLDYLLKNKKECCRNPLFSQACANLLISTHIPKEESVTKLSAKQQYIENTKKYLKTNYHKRITMNDVAQNSRISRAYLRNIFYENENMSPQQYLIHIRIQRAIELLKFDIPITEVAHSVGYLDTVQFYKIFKKNTGYSPLSYRKKFFNT